MASQAASVNEAGSGMTRREFLYYIHPCRNKMPRLQISQTAVSGSPT